MYKAILKRVRVTIVAAEDSKCQILRMFVCILALVIQHANRVFSVSYYIAICGPSGSTGFFHIVSPTA